MLVLFPARGRVTVEELDGGERLVGVVLPDLMEVSSFLGVGGVQLDGYFAQAAFLSAEAVHHLVV